MEQLLKQILDELKWQSEILQKMLDGHGGQSRDRNQVLKLMLNNLSQILVSIPEGNNAHETLKNTMTLIKEMTNGH